MKEKNRNILKRAIDQLPDYHLKENNVWQKIEIDLSKSVDVLSDLPRLKAPERTWVAIENKLNELESPLGKAISELPEYRAPAVAWKKIEANLDRKRILPIRNRVFFITKIAASVLVLISVAYGIFRYSQNNKEELARDTFESMEFSAGIEVIYNKAMCKSNPQICDTELFKSLDRELQELKQELEVLESFMKDDDPQMMKYYHRLVNERVEIEKRMIRLIIES